MHFSPLDIVADALETKIYITFSLLHELKITKIQEA